MTTAIAVARPIWNSLNIVETINSGFIGASQDLRNRILVRNAAGLYNIELPASLHDQFR